MGEQKKSIIIEDGMGGLKHRQSVRQTDKRREKERPLAELRKERE